ncbi:MAG: biotin--[Prevotella sp.]|nr:biotin--[acetyl-CoA-carboxylase] ligase [Prevotella sp.]
MPTKLIRLSETDSTNRFLRDYTPAADEPLTVCVADYQTAGRGCGSNTWESERGKNLTFSVLTHPTGLAPTKQFLLSMAGALALKQVLDGLVNDITLKWPNDIYWRDCKLSGTLIETRLSGSTIRDCIFGIGLNVNQRQFLSDAPNPVSLYQILGHEVDQESLLQHIIEAFTNRMQMLADGCADDILNDYKNSLYRREGYHHYRDPKGEFEAAIIDVEPDGHLLLRDRQGELRRYAFKEVGFGEK